MNALSAPRPGADPHDQLSSLHAILVLSRLMNESGDEVQILHLAATAVPSLARCRLEGTHTTTSGWQDTTLTSEAVRRELEAQIERLGPAGGELTLPGRPWAGALPIRSRTGVLGHLVISGHGQLSRDERFVLSALTQQCGVAVANARLIRRQRAILAQAAATNAALERTVDRLERSTAGHDTLTRVAASSEGLEGIAGALHELTGYAVAIEDRYGNLRVWEGPGEPRPYPKAPPERRERLLRELAGKSRPVRDGNRLVTLASPRQDVLMLLALVHVPEQVDDIVCVALEHGTTVLSMKLAQMRAIAEVELRVRRDLGEDLLAGTEEAGALSRATALGYDLERSHRVVLVEGHTKNHDADAFLHVVRRRAKELDVGTLVLGKGGAVVVFACDRPRWEELRGAILPELGGGRCLVAVGGVCEHWREIPRSYREALLVLSLQRSNHFTRPVIVVDDLGFYRVLSSVSDFSELERFMRSMLGSLLDYDTQRSSEMTKTLARFLDCGRNHDTTSRALLIAGSTLKYRLHRIRDLSGHDLNDPDTRLNLHLATRAWQTLQALSSADAIASSSDLDRVRRSIPAHNPDGRPG